MTLYAACAWPGDVYEYDGTSWSNIGSLTHRAVLCLMGHEGELYAGIKDGAPQGWVYRYDGGTSWSVFAGPFDQSVECMVVYKDELYAGTSWTGGEVKLYNLSGGSSLATSYSDWSGVRSAYEYGGWLHLGDMGLDIFVRWDGTTLEQLADFTGSCIWDYASYGGSLYAGAYMGRLFVTHDGVNWSQVTETFLDRNIWALEVFQGDLYAGLDWESYWTMPKVGQLRRGTDLEVVWEYPVENPIEGILCLATDDNYLYMGTGTEASYFDARDGSGVVYRWDGTQAEAISGVLCEGIQDLYFFEPGELGEIRGLIIRAGQNVDPTAEFITFQNVAGNDVGKIIGSGVGGISYATSSDLRLKKVLGEVNEQTALDALRVKPVRFTSIHDDRTELHGFRAQELAGSTKGVVMFDESQDLYTMDYGRLATYLWRGWQMQEREIDALLKAVDKLKKEGEQCA